MKKTQSIRQSGKHAGIKIQSRGEKVFDACLNAFGVILVAIILYPIYYVLIASVSQPLPVENGSVILTPVGFNLDSYRQAFRTPFLWTSLMNSLYYTFTLVSHVCLIIRPIRHQFLAELCQFLFISVASRRINQPAGKAEGAVIHGLAQ